MKVKLTFTEPLLGTLPGNKELAEDFVVAKHPKGMSKEEMDALADVPEVLQKSSTFFSRNTAKEPILWDYQIKGFFKSACAALIHTGKWTKEHLKKYRLTEYLYKKTIDELVFVYPRQIPITLTGKLSFIERPLRAQTMKGERIALARSESAPAQSSIIIEIQWDNENLKDWVIEWLNRGKRIGLGQWRNGSYGRFTWQEVQ